MIHNSVKKWEKRGIPGGKVIRRLSLTYALVLLASVAAVYGLVQAGAQIFPEAALTGFKTPAAAENKPLFLTLCSLLIVIVVTRVLGSLFIALKQPRVIGEIIGGILLGPSALGAVAPGVAAAILPASSLPFLSVISQIGILLFMFLIGLELDLSSLRRSGHAALLISHASILLPFLLGLGSAFATYRGYAPAGTPFTAFALFIGVSMSVTAFPVLARILSESGMSKTRVGVLALTCAAIDDATAWCLLALVIGLLHASVSSAVATVILTAVYVLLMFFAVKPLLRRLLPIIEQSREHISETSLAFVLIGLLLSAVATEFIGIHALFGGFLIGAIIPHESLLAKDLKGRLEDLVRVFFLPAFFAFTGLRTQIGLLESGTDVIVCLGLIAVATLGKFGGAYGAGRLAGLNRRDSSIVGVLMNTRGLVGLIVLNAGLDYGVLSPKLFTMLVLMAVVTTFATGPLLRLLRDPESEKESANILEFRESR